jgi:hypothetical protein
VPVHGRWVVSFVFHSIWTPAARRHRCSEPAAFPIPHLKKGKPKEKKTHQLPSPAPPPGWRGCNRESAPAPAAGARSSGSGGRVPARDGSAAGRAVASRACVGRFVGLGPVAIGTLLCARGGWVGCRRWWVVAVVLRNSRELDLAGGGGEVLGLVMVMVLVLAMEIGGCLIRAKRRG